MCLEGPAKKIAWLGGTSPPPHKCDRVRENQAFGQKFCFVDYAGYRSA
jgi:hypothetical protein